MEGVPCPAANTDMCPIFVQEGECYQDTHHKYWPAPDYGSRIEKQFRRLDVNKVTICRWLHNTLHSVALPPEKPTHSEMKKAIDYEL